MDYSSEYPENSWVHLKWIEWTYNLIKIMLKMDVDYMALLIRMENNIYIVNVNLILQIDCTKIY